MNKSTYFAALIATTLAGSATAGNIAEPVMEPEIIIQEVSEQSNPLAIVPLIVFAYLVAAAMKN